LASQQVRRWRVDSSNGAYVIVLDSFDSTLSSGGHKNGAGGAHAAAAATKGTKGGNQDSSNSSNEAKTCRLHAVFTLQPFVPRHHRGHTPNPFRFQL